MTELFDLIPHLQDVVNFDIFQVSVIPTSIPTDQAPTLDLPVSAHRHTRRLPSCFRHDAGAQDRDASERPSTHMTFDELCARSCATTHKLKNWCGGMINNDPLINKLIKN